MSVLSNVQAIESRISQASAENRAAAHVLQTVDARLSDALADYSTSKQEVAEAERDLAARLSLVADIFAADRAGTADHLQRAASVALDVLADCTAVLLIATMDRAALTTPATAPDCIPVAEEAAPEVVKAMTGRGASERKNVETTIAPSEEGALAGAPANRIVDVFPKGWESTATPEMTETPEESAAAGAREESAAAGAREADKVGAHKSNGRAPSKRRKAK